MRKRTMARPKKQRIRMPTLNGSAIGQRIRDLRLKRGWTQRDLANMTRINVSVVSLIEHGHRLPQRDAAIALAVALHRSIE